MSFVKVLLSKVPDLYSFNLVALNKDGIRDVEPRYAPQKDKAIAIDGVIDVFSLLKMNLTFGRCFWFEEVTDLFFKRVIHNLILMIHFVNLLSGTCFVLNLLGIFVVEIHCFYLVIFEKVNELLL